ncbi:MAG TPA: substrate-binding domain-containing protein, partial [Thermoanaerobaculia bacterium]|nr:substrate-binding domain-containing protein [Thermoanaerobaculia bacterium]
MKRLAPLLLLLGACAGERPATDTTATAPAERSFVLYSGRNERLIQPLLDRFTQETGIRVEPRFGESAELAATLMEEGARTPADVFLSQDAAGLGAVARAGLARQLPQDLASKVPARFAGPDGRWVGVSGRARTVVYDPLKTRRDQLPQSLQDVANRRYRGKFGVAPLNASFQSHMAAYSALNGPEALDKLLASITANQPRRYPRNGAIVDAVASGEIAWGLVNHYYVWEAKKTRPALSV